MSTIAIFFPIFLLLLILPPLVFLLQVKQETVMSTLTSIYFGFYSMIKQQKHK